MSSVRTPIRPRWPGGPGVRRAVSVRSRPHPGTTGNINFIQLKANPGGNEMMAIYADASDDLYHRYYDGTSWSALTSALETSISDADKNEPFMFAWKRKQPTAVDLVSL